MSPWLCSDDPDFLDVLGEKGFLTEAVLEIEATVAQDIQLEAMSPVEPRYATGDGPSALVASDFNGDGCGDLAVANWRSDDVSILLGDCQGAFGAPVNFPAGDSPSALVAADFNGDGCQDLAVANQWSDNVSILLGDCQGRFGGPVSLPAGDSPSALVAADFDGDGAADLAFGDSAGVHVAWCGPDVEVSGGPHDLTAVDFDSDGFPDLANLSWAGVFLIRNTSGPSPGPFLRRGDCNDDGTVNISDAVCALIWLFRGQEEPGCLAATDTNADGSTNLSDAVYLLSFLFRRGPAPFDPFPECGPETLAPGEAQACKTAPRSCRP